MEKTNGIDWDDAFLNLAYFEGAEDLPASWAWRAADFRKSWRAAKLDLPYGEGVRERIDLFQPDGPAEGLLIFVHGGYWLESDKSDWSHLAKGALQRNWAVAMPGYTLAPALRVSEIGEQVTRAVVFAATQVEGPIHLVGHSAGGQLVARAMSGRSNLPDHVVRRLTGVTSVSGIHDLRPLLETSLGRSLRLTADEAATESPVLRSPLPNIPASIWTGAKERPEFLRQAGLLREAWLAYGVNCSIRFAPGKDHFSVLDDFAAVDSPLLEAIIG